MNIFIPGGGGFVGRNLCAALVLDGHRVTAVGRSQRSPAKIDTPNFNYLSADTTRTGDWQAKVAENEIVINLAGRSIFTLWTAKTKQAIYDSRTLTTRHIVEALAGTRGTTLINTSAVGYYGDRGEEVLTEVVPSGDDFLSRVARDWESEALKAHFDHARVVLMRFGIVLHRSGGAMAKMIPAFKMFAGGRLGSGRQWFPWIHLSDLIRAHRFIIQHREISGAVNCCAPQPVRNAELAGTLAAVLKRPAWLPTPALAIRTVLGEFGAALLSSQRVIPTVLVEAGFDFTYPDIKSALEEIAGP